MNLPPEIAKMSVADYEDQFGYDRKCPNCDRDYRTSDLTFRPFCCVGCAIDAVTPDE